MRLKLIFRSLISILFIPLICAAQGFGPLTGLTISGDSLVLYSGSDVVTIAAPAVNVVAINYLPDGESSSNTLVLDPALSQKGAVAAVIDTTGEDVYFSTSGLQLKISRSPVRFTLFDGNGKQLLKEADDVGFSDNGIHLQVSGSHFYGLDNRLGGSLNSDDGAEIAAGSQGGAGAPFVWTPDGWGMIIDSDGGTVNIASGDLVYNQDASTAKEDIEIYLITGNPKEIFLGMTLVTGRPPLPPKFSFGFLNTEWGTDESELRSDVDMYRAKHIPLDAYVLDFDWMAWGEDNYGEFRWGDKFPNGPSGVLKQHMDSLGLKLYGIRKPRIHTNTVQGNEVISNGWGHSFTTDYFSGKEVVRIDFRIPGARDWFWQQFTGPGRGYDTGIIGYWNDEADEYGGNFMFMQMQRCEYEGQRQYNDLRVWSINRNFYLGAQRYGYALWSGDIGTGFSSMADQRLFMLTGTLLGVPWWGMDIGGFHGNPSPENYFRWVQFGAFVPVFRVHGNNGDEREPWVFGEEAEAIATRYIRLRYELLPYIYTAAYQTHVNGMPMVRPLVFAYPDDINAVNIADEWLFGPDILVHPVVTAGVSSVNIYFPAGKWVDMHNGRIFDGPGWADYNVSREDIPVFIRSGAVLPMAFAGDYTGDPDVSGILRLVSFGNGTQNADVYEDDGNTWQYEADEIATTGFSQTRSYEKAEMNIDARSGIFSPNDRDYLSEFRFCPRPDSALLDGIRLAVVNSDTLINTSVTSWSWDSLSTTAYVRFPDDGGSHRVELFFPADNTPPFIDTVEVTSDSTIRVGFNEPVQISDGPNGALNKNNYSFSPDLDIVQIVSSISEDEIILVTEHPLKEVEYTLTIAHIADQATAPNIMNPYIFHYLIPERYYVVVQDGVDGYSGTADSHIAENFPDNNMGGNDRFEAARYAGDFDGDDKSALVRFDLSNVKIQDSSLVSAEIVLTLAETRNGEAVKQLGVYRLQQEWIQGTGQNIDGDPARAGQVTWNSARHSVAAWQTPGGDAVSIPDTVISVYSHVGDEYAWDVTDYIRFWEVFPDSNFGVILKEPVSSTNSGTKVFFSSEYAGTSQRPKLVLTYKDPVTAIDEVRDRENIPLTYQLDPNYPNPFNPQTTIRYQLPKSGNVSLTIYNETGQQIKILYRGKQNAGTHQVIWNGVDETGRKVSSGVYFYRIKAGAYTQTRKMLLLK